MGVWWQGEGVILPTSFFLTLDRIKQKEQKQGWYAGVYAMKKGFTEQIGG